MGHSARAGVDIMGLFVAVCLIIIVVSLIGLIWLFNSGNKLTKSKPFNRTLSRGVLQMPCAHEWIEVCRHCGAPRRKPGDE